MRRFQMFDTRPNWEFIVSEQEHLLYDTDPEDPGYHYWTEDAVYSVSTLELEDIRAQVQEVNRICIDAIEWLASGGMGTMGLPAEFFRLAVASWRKYREGDGELDIAGRFDFLPVQDLTTGGTVLKLLEYNADTPTTMVESAVCQTSHFDYHFAGDARYTTVNRIGDAFIDRWHKVLKSRPIVEGRVDNDIWFTCLTDPDNPDDLELLEDRLNTNLMMHCAEMAGWNARFVPLQDIAFNSERNLFEAPDGTPISTLWKLYPWEDIAVDEFGPAVLDTYEYTDWFEPAWKMLLSNKFLLAALWQLNPHHPNLVPTFIGGPDGLEHFVRKPIFGRQGLGITVVKKDEAGVDQLVYGDPESLVNVDDDGCVYQEWITGMNFADNEGDHYPTIGVWVVENEVVGFAIRDQDQPVLDDCCHFVPMVVDL